MNIHVKLLAGTAFLALAVTHSVPALAQSDNAPREADEGSIVVLAARNALTTESETGSRLDISPLETPATVNTLDGDAIRARGDWGYVDAVTRAPGVTSAANPGNANTAMVVRGFAGQASVMQLYNGVRLIPNNSSITFPFDTWNVEHVEVLNGPGSVLYGQGALGGVINVVPKSANFERLEVQALASYGTWDTVQLSAGAGGPLTETLAFRADASFRRSDGYVDRGESESLALSGALEWRPSSDFTLTLRHDFGNQQPMKYYGTPLADNERLDTSIRRENYSVLDGVMEFQDHRTQLDLRWTVAEGLQLVSAAYYLDSFRNWQNMEEFSWDTTTNLVTRGGSYGLIHDVYQIGNQTYLSYRTPVGEGITNQLVAGVDLNRVALDYRHNFADEYSDMVDAFDFDPGYFLNTVGIRPRYKTRTNIYSFYIEDRLEIGDAFSLIAGLRYEKDRVGRWNFVYDETGTTIIGESPALNGGLDSHKTFQDVTWRLGAVYQPNPNVSLFGQYVTGVDPVANLTSFSGSTSVFAFSHAKGNQMEVGAKAVFLDGAGAATVSLYRLVKNDLSAQRELNGPIEQIGRQSSKGVEATLWLQLPAGFSIDANATVLDAEYDDFLSGNIDYTGNTPLGVPEVAANATLVWTPLPPVALRTSLRYVGRRFANDSNTLEIPGYLVVDIGASAQLRENLALDLRVLNLFDKDYALATNYTTNWVLGAPRSIEVALRTNF